MVDICSLPSSTVVKAAGSAPWLGSSEGSPASEGAAVGVGLPSALEQAHRTKAIDRASRRAVSFFVVFIFIHLH